MEKSLYLKAQEILAEIKFLQAELDRLQSPVFRINFETSNGNSTSPCLSTKRNAKGNYGLRGLETFADKVIEDYRILLGRKINELEKEFENL